MQHHILYLSGLDRHLDHRTARRYEARARAARAEVVRGAVAWLGRGVARFAAGLAAGLRGPRTAPGQAPSSRAEPAPGLVAYIRRRLRVRATIRALEALDDRQLTDIGVHRGAIRTVAGAAAERGATVAGREPLATVAPDLPPRAEVDSPVLEHTPRRAA